MTQNEKDMISHQVDRILSGILGEQDRLSRLIDFERQQIERLDYDLLLADSAFMDDEVQRTERTAKIEREMEQCRQRARAHQKELDKHQQALTKLSL